jgi:hypothetical protein
MNFDLHSRSSRLEKEQAKRREEAKKKREQELKAQAEKKRAEEELAELARKRKIEAEIAEEQRRLEEEADLVLTGGIKYKESFSDFFSIKDSEDDKIILPESALQELTSQDAFGSGAAVFELSLKLPDRPDVVARITHCGVREFSAAPKTLGLPSKIVDTLWEDSTTPLTGTVTIKYIKLPKVTYVKLQPKLNTFFKVEPVKMVLEENLRCHATLTVGDIVTVWYRGASHPLRVVEMKPEPKGTLIDTDVEVDLDNSEEHLQKQSTESQKEQSASGGRLLGSNTSAKLSTAGGAGAQDAVASYSTGYKLSRSEDPPSASVTSSSVTQPSLTDSSSSSAKIASSVFSTIGASSSSVVSSAATAAAVELPAEPEAGAENVISVRVKTPTGGTLSRRFLNNNSLKLLFAYVSAQTGMQQGALQLSTRFPPRVFSLESLSSDVSFVDAGITASQETFMATPLKSH